MTPRSACCARLALRVALLAALLIGHPGCQSLPRFDPTLLNGQARAAKADPADREAAPEDAPTAPPDRADAVDPQLIAALKGGRWARTLPTAKPDGRPRRWTHLGVDKAAQARDAQALEGLARDPDRALAANAAIALARRGDPDAIELLSGAVADPQLETNQRAAAIEAIALVPAPAASAALQSLLDELSVEGEGYQPGVHAELLLALADRKIFVDDQALLAAVRAPAPEARRAALLCYASAQHGLPLVACDLRTDPDPHVRAAAMQAIGACKPAGGERMLSAALVDGEFYVRTAAIEGLGAFGGEAARDILRKQLDDPGEVIRAQALEALVACGDLESVVARAADPSWRVRRVVAAALGKYPSHTATTLIERLLADASPDVEKTAVEAVACWPLEQGGRLLLAACASPALGTRQIAAQKLAERWPAAREFSATAPPERREAMLAELASRWTAEFGIIDESVLAIAPARARTSVGDDELATIRQLISELATTNSEQRKAEAVAQLARHGDQLLAAVIQLHEREQLPVAEEVFSRLLPEHNPEFKSLEALRTGDVNERRGAALALATLASHHALAALAVERLASIMLDEQDQVVWTNALRAIANDAGPSAFAIAYAGIRNPSPEVRRQACEYLAAHPAPAHANQLTLALHDPVPGVARAAARSLGRCGPLPDLEPLKAALRSHDPWLRLAAGASLARLGDDQGRAALERTADDADADLRQAAAQAMGDAGDARFAPTLVRLLDDRASIRRVALESLTQIVGTDVGRLPGETTVSFDEQARRWRKWWQTQSEQPTAADQATSAARG